MIHSLACMLYTVSWHFYYNDHLNRSCQSRAAPFDILPYCMSMEFLLKSNKIKPQLLYNYSSCHMLPVHPIRPCSHLFRFAFRSRSGPVPLVRVAFTPAKIDRARSGCGPVTRSHLFRNATGTHTISVIDEDGLLSMDRYDVNCPNFGLERNFGRWIFHYIVYSVRNKNVHKCLCLWLRHEIKFVTTSVTFFILVFLPGMWKMTT